MLFPGLVLVFVEGDIQHSLFSTSPWVWIPCIAVWASTDRSSGTGRPVPRDHQMVGGYCTWLKLPHDPIRVGWQKESEARPDAFQTPCTGRLRSGFKLGIPLTPYVYGKWPISIES
jgi:hypothetical protein